MPQLFKEERQKHLSQLCSEVDYDEAIQHCKSPVEETWVRQHYDVDTIELPKDLIGEMFREQAKLDSEVNVMCREGVGDYVDKWDIINGMKLKDIEHAHNEVHVWFDDEITVQRKVASATHWQPAEYEHVPHRVMVNIIWDMNPENRPMVEMEVEEK